MVIPYRLIQLAYRAIKLDMNVGNHSPYWLSQLVIILWMILIQVRPEIVSNDIGRVKDRNRKVPMDELHKVVRYRGLLFRYLDQGTRNFLLSSLTVEHPWLVDFDLPEFILQHRQEFARVCVIPPLGGGGKARNHEAIQRPWRVGKWNVDYY